MPTLQATNGGGDSTTTDPEKGASLLILSFLKKHNLKETEEFFKREAGVSDDDIKGLKPPSDADVQSVLSLYASDENPDEYTDSYNQLKNFIDFSMDAYKYELGQVLWPVFVHLYLELVYNEHEMQASAFFIRFSKLQETFYESDLVGLGSIMKKEQLITCENPFKALHSGSFNRLGPHKSSTGLYVVRMSREALSLLNRFLQENRLKLIQTVVQDRMYIEVYDGSPRGKATINAVAGHFMGESLRADNKAKVYYGLLKEPDLQNVPTVEEDEEDGGPGDATHSSQPPEAGGSTPIQGVSASSGTPGGSGSVADKERSSLKKKKTKRDWLSNKKSKNDPNAPPLSRMPIPELRDIDKIEKVKALREASKRVQLGTDRLPSVCMYTVLNGDHQVISIRWSDDGTLLAVGFNSSNIKVWSITTQKLKKLKKASDLADIDRESDDVLVRMIDERTGEPFRYLRGHSGPVNSVEFSLDKFNLLSASEDGTIRLWSLLTWTCLVVYKGHVFPVWKAVFSPHGGYYFASCGHDRTARLWTTDNYQPLRIFAGHYSDVTQVEFHPNSNYIASGGYDRSVRLWDNVSGSCVRLMTGHKGTIQVLRFSNDGRFLASGSLDGKVIVWDLSSGCMLTMLGRHEGPVYALTFSREGNILATGGRDCAVRLWNFAGMTEDISAEESGTGTAILPKESTSRLNGSEYYICEFLSKQVPAYTIHFTRRNILLVSGPFSI